MTRMQAKGSSDDDDAEATTTLSGLSSPPGENDPVTATETWSSACEVGMNEWGHWRSRYRDRSGVVIAHLWSHPDMDGRANPCERP